MPSLSPRRIRRTVLTLAFVSWATGALIVFQTPRVAADAADTAWLHVDNAGAVWPVIVDPTFAQQAYLKASNTQANDQFGYSVAISGDTAVVGAHFESSNATTIDGDQANNSATQSGAAYVFVRSGTGWSQQAYLKASNTAIADDFGHAVAISGDTIVVGAPNQGPGGAAYVFLRNGNTWSQQGYLKASNEQAFDGFGTSVAVSGDTIVVGAYAEDSSAVGVDGDQANNSALESGAAYVFVRIGTTWSQRAYLKASNSNAQDNFGFSVGVSGDTVVVGAFRESSNSIGVDGDQSSNIASQAGAAYVFVRTGTTWSQQAYLKASNTGLGDVFGYSVAVSGDTVVVGARNEASNATGVNGDQTNNSSGQAGAAYVFVRSGASWSQQAYLKASNTQQGGVGDFFGSSVAVSGEVVVVGAIQEDSNSSGVDGNQADNSLAGAGAAYVFVRSGGTWRQHSYLKASNPGFLDEFGSTVAVSSGTVVVGAAHESSNAIGVNGNEADNSASQSGAAYVFELPNTAPTISSFSVTRWPGTSDRFTIAAVDDAEDGPGFLRVSIESANPSNGVTVSGLANVAGGVTADVAVEPGASSASFVLRVADIWGGFAENTFDVTVVPRVSITPNISPAANANGWHNGSVTVSWNVANSTSGCNTTVLSSDTPVEGTTLTCTAANGGGSSSASVTIKIDRTAPLGNAARTPLPNANGWANTDVTVNFTCTDTLSGILTAASSQTINTEGAGQSRAFTCADQAGNSLPLSVMGVNIDKTAPGIVAASFAATPNPVMVNAAVSLAATLTDTGSSNLARAEFKIDAAPYALLASASGASATVTGSIGSFATPSVLNACVRASDLAGNQSPEECILIAVYDPSGGYVTGAGTFESPSGALAGSTLTGTARFGFQSKYARGATVPTGNTQFKFRAGDFEFDSISYEWLVVAGARGQYKGTGVIKNQPGTFDFVLTTIDGELPGGGGLDKFRIKISSPGGVVYDNQTGAADSADPSTVIASGHIVIRK